LKVFSRLVIDSAQNLVVNQAKCIMDACLSDLIQTVGCFVNEESSLAFIDIIFWKMQSKDQVGISLKLSLQGDNNSVNSSTVTGEIKSENYWFYLIRQWATN
jgi:hypothetical protein